MLWHVEISNTYEISQKTVNSGGFRGVTKGETKLKLKANFSNYWNKKWLNFRAGLLNQDLWTVAGFIWVGNCQTWKLIFLCICIFECVCVWMKRIQSICKILGVVLAVKRNYKLGETSIGLPDNDHKELSLTFFSFLLVVGAQTMASHVCYTLGSTRATLQLSHVILYWKVLWCTGVNL